MSEAVSRGQTPRSAWDVAARPLLLVVSGPSGAGKTEAVRELCERRTLARSVSATTREPRVGEQDGVDYHFLHADEFMRRVRDGEFAEWAQYRSHCYGTLRATLDDAKARGEDTVLEIDVQGGAQVRARYPDALLLFILPPDMDILRARSTSRGTETPEVRERRLQSAAEEIPRGGMYDYAIVNYEGRLGRTVDLMEAVIDADRQRISARQATALRAYNAETTPSQTSTDTSGASSRTSSDTQEHLA